MEVKLLPLVAPNCDGLRQEYKAVVFEGAGNDLARTGIEGSKYHIPGIGGGGTYRG